MSFIARLEKLIDDGFFEENKIDTLLLFGGTNDSWSNAPLGDKKDADWTKEDLFCVLPAFSYLINLMQTKLPEVKVYCILNTWLKPEIAEYYTAVCNAHGVDVIQLCNIDKICGHPTILGMEQIKDQILNSIRSNR